MCVCVGVWVCVCVCVSCPVALLRQLLDKCRLKLYESRYLLQLWVEYYDFYKDGFVFKLTTKFEIPLNKQTKPKILCVSVFTQYVHHEQPVTKSQFLSGVRLVWMNNFHSSKVNVFTKDK